MGSQENDLLVGLVIKFNVYIQILLHSFDGNNIVKSCILVILHDF